jgi:adenylylsulfate kinase-like enzyme
LFEWAALPGLRPAHQPDRGRRNPLVTMKIAVTGTHSTGKTTFINAVREELQGQGYRVAVVSDLGEEALNRGFPILYQHTPESTLWIMTTGIARELEAALTPIWCLWTSPSRTP